MLAEYTARNQQALEQLVNQHGVQFKPLPADVLDALRAATDEVLAEITARDPFARRVHESLMAFRKQAGAWHRLSEVAFYSTREAG